MKQYDISSFPGMVENSQGFWIETNELLQWLKDLALEIKNTAGYDSPPYRMCIDLIAELEN